MMILAKKNIFFCTSHQYNSTYEEQAESLRLVLSTNMQQRIM